MRVYVSPNLTPICCWLMFVFMGGVIMENDRHLDIFKNAAVLSNMFVVPMVEYALLFGTFPRMAHSSSVYFEFIILFFPERARAL